MYPTLSLLLAATLWGIFWYPLRLLEDNGLSGLWATLFIYLGTLPILIILFYQHRQQFFKNFRLLTLIALASGWTNTAFILAIIDGPIVRVMILFYISPLWATLFGVLILKEKLTFMSVLMLIIALTGAIIMLWQEDVSFPLPSSSNDWLALSSGFAFALTNVLARKAEFASVQLKVVFSWVGVIIISGIMLLFENSSLNTVSAQVILSAILIGTIFIVIMTTAVMYGVSHMPVQRSAIILLFELIVAVVSASLLTNEIVLIREWVGGLFILSAGYFASKIGIKESTP
ncbi:MAG: DMT family transporter [Thiohalomonadales bacterium]